MKNNREPNPPDSGLDRIDFFILRALNLDARASSAEIARQVGVPERTVHNRIRKLIEGSYLKPTGVVNPQAFGYTLAVDIFCEIDLGMTNEALEALGNMSEVTYIAISTGDQDLSIQAVFQKIEDMQDFITTKLPLVPGMRRTRTVLIPRIIKDTHQWLPPASIFDEASSKRGTEGEENSKPGR